jgi:hypothetical protein
MGVTSKLSLQASYIANQAAPSLSNLGAAQTSTYNVSVYDFARGQSTLATVITGGNPDLVRESRHDIKLGINWTLPVIKNSNLIVEYFDNRSKNVSTSFPALTAAVLGAYPGRVTRDAMTGAITQIDERPVTLADQHEKRIRWGFNISGNMGKPLPPVRRRGMFGMDGPPPGGPPPGGTTGGEGGVGLRRRFRGRGGGSRAAALAVAGGVPVAVPVARAAPAVRAAAMASAMRGGGTSPSTTPTTSSTRCSWCRAARRSICSVAIRLVRAAAWPVMHWNWTRAVSTRASVSA